MAEGLKNSFDKTNLDLESNLEIGGPIGDTLSGFVHKYLPGSKYPSQGELQPESPLMEQYNKTNLDLTSDEPEGGPINDPASGFEQKYTPNNPYYTENQGTLGETSFQNAQTQLGITGLDNSDEAAGVAQGGTGGPNRISSDIPTGEYRNVNLLNGSTVDGPIPIQRWNVDNPYFQSVNGVPEIPPPTSETQESSNEDVTGTDMSMDPSAVDIP
tara:strand:+ start:5736 stop:6377 length:642 start_codon:yes stop_codon:yes gene_type:complete